MPKKVLYRKTPLAPPKCSSEALKSAEPRNGMTKAIREHLKPEIEEAEEAEREAKKRLVDLVTSLIGSRTVDSTKENGKTVLIDWFSGQRFPDRESVKAHFGKNLELVRRAGSRYVAEGDVDELARVVRRANSICRAEKEAREFLQIRNEESDGRVIVGRKPGRNYVVAAVYEICRRGSVSILGRNVGKVKAIAEICRLAWPELKQLDVKSGSEQVNGMEMKNVEITLGV